MKRILMLGLLVVVAMCNGPVVAAQTPSNETKQASEKPSLSLDQTILEEYKIVREEINLCLGERVSIVSLGFAAIGTILAGGLTMLSRKKEHWLAAAVIIGVVVTLTGFYVFDVWMTETQRLARASAHNYYLEQKLKNLYASNVMPIEWEHRIRSNDEPYKSLLPSDEGTPRIFLVVSCVSALYGIWLFWSRTKGDLGFQKYRISVVLLGILLLGWGLYVRVELIRSLSGIWKLTPS
jgi:hypothetical protein